MGLLNFAIKPELLKAVVDVRPQAVWLAAGPLHPHFQKLSNAGEGSWDSMSRCSAFPWMHAK